MEDSFKIPLDNKEVEVKPIIQPDEVVFDVDLGDKHILIDLNDEGEWQEVQGNKSTLASIIGSLIENKLE